MNVIYKNKQFILSINMHVFNKITRIQKEHANNKLKNHIKPKNFKYKHHICTKIVFWLKL